MDTATASGLRPPALQPAADDSAARRASVFLPKLFTLLPTYTWSAFGSDAAAGLIVGLVALPLAIAFAIASGVTPDRGLITAIVAGFIISALGGSRVQIGGPTGAYVVVVYKIVQQHGLEGLTIATLMAGVILLAMGLMRLGTLIKYIPYSLTVGFTSGIAVVIFSSEVKDFLGLHTGAVPADFLAKWDVYLHAMGTMDPATVAVGAGSLLLIAFWPKVSRRVPGPIVAVVLASIAAKALHLNVETIGSRFGDLPSALPRPSISLEALARWRSLFGPAITIALLGAIESLLSATVADSMIGARHRSNTELVAQGLANLGSAAFGGIPATGAIARTATNIKNGGRTPVAGMVHALTLLAVMMALGRWAKLIPLSALAAILVVVSYHMSEWRQFRALLKAPRSDVAVLLATFFLTVLVDLTVGVTVGMILAMALFVRRMTEVSMVREFKAELERDDAGADVPLPAVPAGVAAYEARGALAFGVVESLRDVMGFGATPPKTIVLGMKDVLALDGTALRALSDLDATCRRHGTRLILAGVHSQPKLALDKAGFTARLGAGNVLADDIAAVVARLR